MASPILHIKDAYYFDVPKFLWRADYQGVALEANNPFPEFWVRLDPDYQLWEAKSLYDSELKRRVDDLPEWSDLRHEFLHWQHEGTNHGKPFTTFILETKEWFPESDDFDQSLQFGNYTLKITPRITASIRGQTQRSTAITQPCTVECSYRSRSVN